MSGGDGSAVRILQSGPSSTDSLQVVRDTNLELGESVLNVFYAMIKLAGNAVTAVFS